MIEVTTTGFEQALTDFQKIKTPTLGDIAVLVGAKAAEMVSNEMHVLYPPASAPGEHPHIRTGNLKKSIGSDVVESGPSSATARVFADIEYAVDLEFGASGEGFELKPRPFMHLDDDQIDELANMVLEALIG